MTLTDLRLPSPGTTLGIACVVVAGVWLVFDFVLRDPWTYLFVFITFGIRMVWLNVTSGAFTDIYWPVVVASQVAACVLLFALPGLAVSRLAGRRLSPAATSLAIIGWLLFYIAALGFLFQPTLPTGLV